MLRMTKGELLGDVAPKVEIFSLGENVWKKIKNPGVPRLDIRGGKIRQDPKHYPKPTRKNTN